jgi:ribosomal protein L16/L10AE
MGKGKGKIKNFVVRVVKGDTLIEINGIDYRSAKKILLLAAKKLPLRSYFIYF